MRVKKIRGVHPLCNGRGPFHARVTVHGIGRMDVICGKDRMHKRLGNSPLTVCVVRPKPAVGWFQQFTCPVQAETVARMISCLGDLREDQLEAMGFVEDRREQIKK